MSQRFFTLNRTHDVLPTCNFFTCIKTISTTRELRCFRFFVTSTIYTRIEQQERHGRTRGLRRIILSRVTRLANFVGVTPTPFSPRFFYRNGLGVVGNTVIPIVRGRKIDGARHRRIRRHFFAGVIISAMGLTLLRMFTGLVVSFLQNHRQHPRQFLRSCTYQFDVRFYLTGPFTGYTGDTKQRNGMIGNSAVFLVRRHTRATRYDDIVSVRVAGVRAYARNIPWAFVGNFFRRDFRHLTSGFNVDHFVPIDAPCTSGPNIQIRLANFFRLVRKERRFAAHGITFHTRGSRIANLNYLHCHRIVLLGLAGPMLGPKCAYGFLAIRYATFADLQGLWALVRPYSCKGDTRDTTGLVGGSSFSVKWGSSASRIVGGGGGFFVYFYRWRNARTWCLAGLRFSFFRYKGHRCP